MVNLQSAVISQLAIDPQALLGETVVVTGAGGGIGYEAARALLSMGANVVIAEINEQAGRQAAAALAAEYSPQRVLFVPTDVGDEASVQVLAAQSTAFFGTVDAVINNATIAVLGAVKDLPIEKWDASYRVNLRGPVLMAQAFLPGMISRKHGVFVCVSSTGTAYLGGYETFKAAQVHLANTLDAELEGTGVVAFTIGPGLVPTDTASRAVEQLAPLMGMTVDEFFASNQGAVLTVEEAGTGFAVAVARADQYRGEEISSPQVLMDAGYRAKTTPASSATPPSGAAQRAQALALCRAVRTTLDEQSQGWQRRSLFERQWVIRDFKKTAGMPVEEWLHALARLEESLEGSEPFTPPPLERLAGYYQHLADLAKGYERDPMRLEENLRHVMSWRDEAARLEWMLKEST